MKKYHSVVFVGILATLAVASVAIAQTTSTTTPHGRLNQLRQEVQEKRAEIKARLDERRQQLITMYTERTVNRFSAVINRLEDIADRLGTRLDKLAAQNASVNDARTKLEAARVKITDAKTVVENIVPAVRAVLTSDNPKGEFAKAKGIIVAAQEKIKEAHAALVTVVSSIKPGTTRATSTPSTSIDKNAKLSVIVLSPASGSVFSPSNNITVSWRSSSPVNRIQLLKGQVSIFKDFYVEPGQTSYVINLSLVNQNILNGLQTSHDYSVRVYSSTIWADSSRFTITSATQ